MPATLSFELAPGVVGALPGPNGMVKELVSVTGSSTAAGDTGVYATQFVKQPAFVEGPFGVVSISGNDVTVSSIGALVDAQTYQMIVIGYGGLNSTIILIDYSGVPR